MFSKTLLFWAITPQGVVSFLPPDVEISTSRHKKFYLPTEMLFHQQAILCFT